MLFLLTDSRRWWYGPILSSDTSFPFACRQTLTGFLLSISSHLSRKRPADTFLDFLTNSTSIVIVFLNELSSALMSPGSANLEPADALHQYLGSDPESSLANVLDIEQQRKKLSIVAEDILHTFLDSQAYNCDPVKVFLREILAGVVLEMTVQSCSKPEWINGWIIYLLEEGDAELMNAIDAGVGGASASHAGKASGLSTTTEGSTALSTSFSEAKNDSQTKINHKRTVSRAEDAMEEAMQEAKRLSDLIAADEARNNSVNDEILSSGTTTACSATPTSSQSDLVMIGDSEGEEFPPHIPNTPDRTSCFTTFDQILPLQQPTALKMDSSPSRISTTPVLTLHNASVSIFDDSTPGDKGTMRSKPVADYMLQIEPATSQHPGWMIARQYTDLETLHEVLRRISVVSGVAAFTERHATIPGWKNRTKAALRSDLEKYLHDALSFSQLAESEGMKRFLEKNQGLGRSSLSVSKGGFGFPSPAAFETMGKGMLDVLASAPKGAAGGGKFILGGVTGVLGGVGSIGQKKQPPMGSAGATKAASSSNPTFPTIDSSNTSPMDSWKSRESQDNVRRSLQTSNDSMKPPPLPSRPRQHSLEHQDENSTPNNHPPPISDNKERPWKSPGSPILPDTLNGQDELHLPPPPSEIPDDYNTFQDPARPSTSANDRNTLQSSTSTVPNTLHSSERQSTSIGFSETPLVPSVSAKQEQPPLTYKETQVAVELFFAVINELYTLSSAWNIRRTLLNAAKGFLLRPGNPNLEAIRFLLQNTIIDANTTDTGLASHLIKLRENALPTEEELKTWPPIPSDDEKLRLKIKARRLLVERGMPQALTSVMGAAASGEALGRVFDCLQVEEVARGLMFALALQGVKAVTQ